MLWGKKQNKKEMDKKRFLPIGVTEFHAWSENIILGARLEGVTEESLKYILANELMHLAPGCQAESDGYFIARLRKFAVNQVADQIRRDIYEKRKAQEKPLEEAKMKEETKLKVVSETNEKATVLADQGVQNP